MDHIGIVVLNYNNSSLSIRNVDHLLKMGIEYPIVIVDNASSDDSYILLSEHYKNVDQVSVIESEKNGGYSYGNNYGIRFLLKRVNSIRYICIMNPDVEILYPEIFENLRTKLESNEDIAAITGIMLTRGEKILPNCCWSIPKGKRVALDCSALSKRDAIELAIDDQGIARVEVIPGSFFMIKKDVYERIGEFDEETFLFEEENILAIEIKKLEMTNALSVSDAYNHNHVNKKKSLRQKIATRRIGYRSRIYLCKKYYRFSDLILLYAVILSNYILIPLKYYYAKVKKS